MGKSTGRDGGGDDGSIEQRMYFDGRQRGEDGSGSPYRGRQEDAGPVQPIVPEEPTCSASDWRFTLPTCGACAESSCCDALNACGRDCQGYRDCVTECTTTACVTTCRSTWTAGTKAYDKVLGCFDVSCKAECVPKKGIGDSCTKDSECEPCSRGSDCNNPRTTTNENGSYNYCVPTSSGKHYCFPGCSGTAFCTEHYANDATCKSVTTSGGTVPICSF